MPEPVLPTAVARLASELTGLPGVEAVVLGGSRAVGAHRPDSDWDLGLYYRRSRRLFDPERLRDFGYDGHVSALGEWGPIVHGGAWLTIDDTPVDVLFRDLDTVEAWIEDAGHGRFEVLSQNGYVVGAPTYIPVGELALCRPIAGELPRPEFTDALAASAPDRWNGRASVSLMYATRYAAAGDVVCCTGMLIDAALSAAHARLAQRREWALNEKRLLHRAGLDDVQALLSPAAGADTALPATVAAVIGVLGIAPLTARP
jgi:predicted nucleotidyltransferase